MSTHPSFEPEENMLTGFTFSLDSIVEGKSPRMRAVFDLVRTIADSMGTVLITGESWWGEGHSR
jgi:DNA-binding NtrC family response regulator